MRDGIGQAILLVAGAAILASGVLHGVVNVPHLKEDLLELGVRPTLIAAVMIGLYFSVVAMLAFGGMVVGSAVEVSREGPSQPVTLWIIAANYAAFGVAGFMLVSRTPHMLGYAGMGLLVALGAALTRARTKGDTRGVA